MNKYATRSPKRVAVTARAKRNAVKISQTVVLLKPENTWFAGSVRVKARTVIASSALTPMGTGCATSEVMVARNTADRWRCCAVRPGTGVR